jgi:NADH:ubiquinone oxidoreductase subunit
LDAKEKHSQKGIKRRGGGMRQAVQGFSEDSRRRMLFTFRNVVGLRVLLTLTYPGKPELVPTDGKVVKAHWDAMRRWLVHHGVRGAWCLEFQWRGAVHFHVYLTGEVPKEMVAKAWNRIAGQNDPDHLKAGIRIEALREVHAAGAYAAKYLKKQEQKEVPEQFSNVGRFWGLFGGLSVQPLAEVNSEERIDTATGEVVSGGAVQAARVMRRLVNVRRRAAGRRRFRDSGRQGFTGYGCGPAMLRYLEGRE